jgi:hypothetical protein
MQQEQISYDQGKNMLSFFMKILNFWIFCYYWNNYYETINGSIIINYSMI